MRSARLKKPPTVAISLQISDLTLNWHVYPLTRIQCIQVEPNPELVITKTSSQRQLMKTRTSMRQICLSVNHDSRKSETITSLVTQQRTKLAPNASNPMTVARGDALMAFVAKETASSLLFWLCLPLTCQKPTKKTLSALESWTASTIQTTNGLQLEVLLTTPVTRNHRFLRWLIYLNWSISVFSATILTKKALTTITLNQEGKEQQVSVAGNSVAHWVWSISLLRKALKWRKLTIIDSTCLIVQVIRSFPSARKCNLTWRSS